MIGKIVGFIAVWGIGAPLAIAAEGVKAVRKAKKGAREWWRWHVVDEDKEIPTIEEQAAMLNRAARLIRAARKYEETQRRTGGANGRFHSPPR